MKANVEAMQPRSVQSLHRVEEGEETERDREIDARLEYLQWELLDIMRIRKK